MLFISITIIHCLPPIMRSTEHKIADLEESLSVAEEQRNEALERQGRTLL